MLFRGQPRVLFLVCTLLRPLMPNSRVPIEYNTLHFLCAEREDERDSSADSPPDRRGLGAAWVTYEGNIENSSVFNYDAPEKGCRKQRGPAGKQKRSDDDGF
ncbi:hypothetical protein B0H13DRAFT_1893918 [Mycena leptocephala]|nr:hypothetical protein B0H13DRAFT_1893918 [Mycena leptocephala]